MSDSCGSDRLSPQEWAEGQFVIIREVSPLTVADQTAIAFDSDGLYRGENITFLSPDEEDIVAIAFAQSNEDYEQAFEQLVSTFVINFE